MTRLTIQGSMRAASLRQSKKEKDKVRILSFSPMDRHSLMENPQVTAGKQVRINLNKAQFPLETRQHLSFEIIFASVNLDIPKDRLERMIDAFESNKYSAK